MNPQKVIRLLHRSRSWLCKVQKGIIDNELAEFAVSLIKLEDTLTHLFQHQQLYDVAEFTIFHCKQSTTVSHSQKIKRACIYNNPALRSMGTHDFNRGDTTGKFYQLILQQGDYLETLFLDTEFLSMCEFVMKRSRNGKAKDFASFYHNISSRIIQKLELDKK